MNFKKKIYKNLNRTKILFKDKIIIPIMKKIVFPFFAEHGFRSVLKTKSFTVNQNSQTEIHSLICHNHIYCYLYCIKSLLIHIQNCSVVVHDNGSLTSKDKLNLKKHIKGVIIHDLAKADRAVISQLKNYPLLKRLRGKHVLLKKLTDFSILSKTGKIIALDSDILFLDRPDEIIQWSESNEKIALLSDESPLVSYQDVYLPSSPFKYVPSLNSGLICYYTNMLDFDLAEKAFAIPEFDTKFRPNGIGDQQFMAINFGEAKHNKNLSIKRLSPDLYIHNRELNKKEVILKHYWNAKNSPKSLFIYLRDKKRIYESIRIK